MDKSVDTPVEKLWKTIPESVQRPFGFAGGHSDRPEYSGIGPTRSRTLWFWF